MSALRAQWTMEWRYQLRRPFVWICAAIFFAIAFGDAFQAGLGGQGFHWVNGAESILTRSLTFSLFGILAVAGIVGESASRDRSLRTEEQVLASGADRLALGLSRFAVAWLICAATAAMFMPGTLLGALMPGIAPEQLGPTRLSHYARAIGYILLPNFFIISALMYAVGLRWRSQTIAFLAGVGLLIVWVTTRMQLGQDVLRHDVFPLYALLDPFATIAVAEHTMEWTVSQNNERFVPLSGMLLWNRVLWISLSVLLLAVSIRWMPLRPALTAARQSRRRQRRRSRAAFTHHPLWQMLRWEFISLRRQPNITLLPVLAAFTLWLAASSSLTHQYSLPTTDLLVHSTGFYFDKILILIIAWFAAELVWRERLHRVDELLDVLPTRDTYRLLAKTLTLLAVVLLFWLLSILVNIVYQATHGFFDFELGLYLVDSFVFKAPHYLWMAVLALSLQVLIRRRFVAIGVYLLIYVSPVMLDAFGLFHPVYRFAEVNFFWYSQLDGHGHFWRGHLWMLAYWTLGSALLWTIAWATHARGTAPPGRLSLFAARMRDRRARIALLGLLAAFTFVGGSIWTQTTLLNRWPPIDVEALKADVEKAYGNTWRGRLQPRVVAIDSAYDFYPKERRLEARGTLTLHNHEQESISELLVMSEPELTSMQIGLGRPAERVHWDERLRIEHWRLEQPLAPGERMQLTFEALSMPGDGFRAQAKNDDVPSVSRLEIIGNGTSLLNLQLMPAIGYTDRVEHKPGWKRRKYGLPPEWQAPSGEYALRQPHDTLHLGWVERVDATVTTVADQLPLHAGRVIEDTTTADGRRRIHYRIEGPTRGWSPVMSARLQQHEVDGDDTPAMQFFYDPAQTYTLEHMVAQFGDALRYFQQRYGAPPFETFRLAQQSLHYDGMGNRAGLAFASEILGWKSDVASSEGVVIARMAAHMMGMSWFGDQIIPANLPGAKIIHAGLPYWTAGLYLHRQYGRVKSRELRKQAMAEMFRKRRGLQDEEAAFVDEHKDSTMVRSKGLILMTYLAELIGQDELESALRAFLDEWRHQAEPFPTGRQFVDHLRERIADQHHALLDDIFTRITRWDLRVEKADTQQLANGRWQTEASIVARKFYASGLGDEQEAELATALTIAVAADRTFDNAVTFRTIRPRSGQSLVRIESDDKPAFFGLDPDFLLPDSNTNNQVVRLRSR